MSTQPDSAKDNENQWLDLAIKSEGYIQKAQYQSGDFKAWKVMPDSINSTYDKSLYSGTPGIVLFYLELYHTTKDTTYLIEAVTGADFLTRQLKDTVYSTNEVGLYTGLAGVGFTLTEVYKYTNQIRFRKAALQTVDLLSGSSSATKNGIHWGSIPDIVYGGAGIGLYFQYIAEQLDSEKADSLALLVAEGIMDQAIETENGYRWKFAPNYDRFLDNFSHGTSGVAYFLAQTFKRTKDEKFLDAAILGAEFLESIENEKGYVPHHLPDDENLYYLSWCHGPTGTNRLYYVLNEVTSDEKWLDKIIFSSDHMMTEGIDKTQTPGFWNNVGKCCGASSIAEYYMWLYDITGDEKYLDFSRKMTNLILEKGTNESNYIKWIHAENRVSPGELAAQTGLMQGSAGIGLWFLELHARLKDEGPQIILPDKPQVAVRNID